MPTRSCPVGMYARGPCGSSGWSRRAGGPRAKGRCAPGPGKLLKGEVGLEWWSGSLLKGQVPSKALCWKREIFQLKLYILNHIVFALISLSDEMKTFAGQQIEPLFQFSWLIVFLTLLLCGGLGLLFAFTVDPNLGIAVSLSFLALLYIFFGKSLPFIFLKNVESVRTHCFT